MSAFLDIWKTVKVFRMWLDTIKFLKKLVMDSEFFVYIEKIYHFGTVVYKLLFLTVIKVVNKIWDGNCF